MKSLVLMMVAAFVVPAYAEVKTEGQFLDPSCNCVREPRKNAALDGDMVRKIEEEARKSASRKLLTQVKSYRCPRPPKKEKDEVRLSQYGIPDDEEDAPDVGEVMENLVAKSGVDESLIDGDLRSRAEEALEKKIEKCSKDRQRQLAQQRSENRGAQGQPNSNLQMQMMQMLMAQQMNTGQMGQYGASSMMGMNSNYNPYQTLMNTPMMGTMTPAQQVAMRGYGTWNGSGATFGNSFASPGYSWPTLMNSSYGLRPLSSR